MSSGAPPANANHGCVGPASDTAGRVSGCSGCPNQGACSSGAARVAMQAVDPAVAEVKERMSTVHHKILVLSGKGGVGKSTFSCQMAWLLADMGLNIGVLDIDICGPSVPKILGVDGQEVRKSAYGWSPVYAAENLGVMSIGFMIQGRDEAVIWRGPRKNGMIKQFLTDVYWGDLDCMIVDAPPGTSDEHLSITTYLKESNVDGAVIVTTPQEISLLDVRKEINFCKRVGIPILGVVENMAGFTCPCCKHNTQIFAPSTGGAAVMCEEMGVTFLGSIPLDPYLMRSCEEGRSYVSTYSDAPAVGGFANVVRSLFSCTAPLADTAARTSLFNSLQELSPVAEGGDVAAAMQAEAAAAAAAVAAEAEALAQAQAHAMAVAAHEQAAAEAASAAVAAAEAAAAAQMS